MRPGGTHGTTPPPPSGAHLFQQFLGAWADRFDAIVRTPERKLCAMALLSALALPVNGMPAAAESLLPYVTSVHQEVMEHWLDNGDEFPEVFTLLRDSGLFDAADASDDTMILASEDAEGVPRARLAYSRHPSHSVTQHKTQGSEICKQIPSLTVAMLSVVRVDLKRC